MPSEGEDLALHSRSPRFREKRNTNFSEGITLTTIYDIFSVSSCTSRSGVRADVIHKQGEQSWYSIDPAGCMTNHSYGYSAEHGHDKCQFTPQLGQGEGSRLEKYLPRRRCLVGDTSAEVSLLRLQRAIFARALMKAIGGG